MLSFSDSDNLASLRRSLNAIAEVATATAAAEDPATNHLEKIATAVSLLAESEERVADAMLTRQAALQETDAANYRVAMLNEQLLLRDIAAAPVRLAEAVDAMLHLAKLQAAHLAAATPQDGLQVGRFGDLAVRLPIYEFPPSGYSDGWTQFDPALGAWRSWQGDPNEPGSGWDQWEWGNEPNGGEMPDAGVLCRAVPRGEADASPMSRGPIPAPKAEG